MGKKNSKMNDNNGNSNNGTIELLPSDTKTTPKYYNKEYGKRARIKCKNKEQKDFIHLIENNEIVLCNGPAGCGKTYISIIKSIEYLQSSENKYNKIYIITPNIEISRSLGHLPGNFTDKISVYVNSIFRLVDKIIGEEQRTVMVNNGIIEVIGLGYIRGDNFDNCLLLVDEAQNITKKEMLTILTRIGSECKMIISGDILQIDKLNSENDSGLYHAMEKLNNLDGIGTFTFSLDSIVRNKIISEILKNY